MLDTCVNKIASFLLRNNAISKDEVELHIYGIQKVIGILLTVTITMIFSIIIGKVLATVIFLIFFVGIRSYTGGYHAKTQMRCLLYFQMLYLVTMLLFQPAIQSLPSFAKLGAALTASIILIIFAPVNHPGLCLTPSEIRRSKKNIAVALAVIFIALALMYVVFNTDKADFALLGLINVTILVIVAKITGQEVKQHEKIR